MNQVPTGNTPNRSVRLPWWRRWFLDFALSLASALGFVVGFLVGCPAGYFLGLLYIGAPQKINPDIRVVLIAGAGGFVGGYLAARGARRLVHWLRGVPPAGLDKKP